MDNKAREITQWSEREFCVNRYYNWLGGDIPSTIACKELVDNTTDQISDGKTNLGYLEIGKDRHSVTAVDGGKGISLRQTIRKDTGKTSTFLFLAIAKLFSSTNYDDSQNAGDTVGQNGVGTKLNNFLSTNFTAGIVATHPAKHVSKIVTSNINNDVHNSIYQNPKGKVKGYHFQNGAPTIDGINEMDQAVPEWVEVNVPTFYGETEPFGYFVHAEYDTSILGDDIDVNWIKNYLHAKLSLCKIQNTDIYFTFRYPEYDSNDQFVKMNEIVYVRPVNYKEFSNLHKTEIANGSMEVLVSWDEMATSLVAEHPGEVWGPYTSGYYTIYFAQNPELLKDLNNMAQGAIVENPKNFSASFTIGTNKVNVPVYCVFKLYASNAKGLTYSDQTKRRLFSNQKTPAKLHINNLSLAFNKAKEVKDYFETVANDKALSSSKKIHSDFYWPATGGKTAREFYSKYVDNKDDLLRILNGIQDDPEVIEYCRVNSIDLNNLRTEVEALK